jgi:hypothetical protein
VASLFTYCASPQTQIFTVRTIWRLRSGELDDAVFNVVFEVLLVAVVPLSSRCSEADSWLPRESLALRLEVPFTGSVPAIGTSISYWSAMGRVSGCRKLDDELGLAEFGPRSTARAVLCVRTRPGGNGDDTDLDKDAPLRISSS